MIVALLLLLQAASTDRLPPVNPLPLADADTLAVMAPINALFAGLVARDAQAIAAQLRPEGGATAVTENADGTRTIRHLSWSDYTAGIKPGPERYEERLTDPAVEVDGDIAMVWSPYVFTIDGKLHHCGTDHFDLVREAGRWKILNVTWSQRSASC